jgi:hypothetical protein
VFICGSILLPRAAFAHSPRPEDVIAQLSTPAVRQQYDVREVARDTTVPRLLVVRVGPGWTAASVAERRSAAEQWLRNWRHAVPQGILAIVDVAGGRALVNFDAHGNARVDERASQPAGKTGSDD